MSEHTHQVKSCPRWFAALDEGKRFEVRLNDRGYQKGDTIVINEWNPEKHSADKYTGSRRDYRISFVHSGLGMAEGYVVLGLEPLP